MECKKCGAELEEGATVCPECGEAVEPSETAASSEMKAAEPEEAKPEEPGAPAESPAEVPSATDEAAATVPEPGSEEAVAGEGESVPAVEETTDDEAAEAQAESGPKASRLNRGMIAAIAVVAVIALGLIGYFVYGAVAGNDPSTVTVRFMTAYANYDGRGMLQYATHASMTATEVTQFQQQADAAKKTSKGKPFLKDIKVGKVTIDPKKPNTATVKFSASFLNTQSGTYTTQTESVTLVKQGGKWLVHLF